MRKKAYVEKTNYQRFHCLEGEKLNSCGSVFQRKSNVILLHQDELENLENILTNKNISENK